MSETNEAAKVELINTQLSAINLVSKNNYVLTDDYMDLSEHAIWNESKKENVIVSETLDDLATALDAIINYLLSER